MKYQVQIQYTNPSHEHVTLRRRVETVTRLVEASTEGEALNRAANQQRALGFRIQEAKIVQPASLNEGFDTDPKDIAAYLVDRHGKGKVTMDHIEAYERRRDSHRPIEKHEVMKHVKKMSEEVEQVEEAKDVTKDLRTSMKMMDLRHGVDADKRDKGYKMSSTVRAAQKKFDAQSKGQGKMRPQAGTLAALKKEEAEPKELDGKKKVAKTSKKATKAAEKMIAAAKGKMNKINVQPTMEIDVKSK